MRDTRPVELVRTRAQAARDPARAFLRRAALSAFIVACLMTMTFRNLGVGYIEPDPAWPAPVGAATSAANLGRWAVYQLGWNAGLDGYWRMFSPVHRFDWHWVISAVNADDTAAELPLPNQTPRSTLQRTFVDFREVKLIVNFWQRPAMRAAYAESLCHAARRAGGSPSAIRFEIIWRNIVPPDVALRNGSHLDAEMYRATVDEVPCAP